MWQHFAINVNNTQKNTILVKALKNLMNISVLISKAWSKKIDKNGGITSWRACFFLIRMFSCILYTIFVFLF